MKLLTTIKKEAVLFRYWLPLTWRGACLAVSLIVYEVNYSNIYTANDHMHINLLCWSQSMVKLLTWRIDKKEPKLRVEIKWMTKININHACACAWEMYKCMNKYVGLGLLSANKFNAAPQNWRWIIKLHFKFCILITKIFLSCLYPLETNHHTWLFSWQKCIWFYKYIYIYITGFL